MYYSAFQRKNCCPARQPSAFWTLWSIWYILPLRIRLRAYFSVAGEANEMSGQKKLSSVPPSRFFTSPHYSEGLKKYLSKDCLHMSWCVWIERNVAQVEVQLQREHTFTCLTNYSRTSGVDQMRRWDVWGMWCQTPAAARWKCCHLSKGQVVCGIIVALHTYGDDLRT